MDKKTLSIVLTLAFFKNVCLTTKHIKCKCTFGNGSSVFTALLQNIAEGACFAGYKRAVMQGGAWVGRGEGCMGSNFFSLP